MEEPLDLNIGVYDLLPLVEIRLKYRLLDTVGLVYQGKHLTDKFFDGCQELFENQGEMDFAFGFALANLIDGAIRFNPEAQPFEIASMVHDIVMHAPEV